MSTALLQDLQQEVRRIYIAGSDLAAGDFRLKRLLPQFEKLGERAPVFKRIGELIQSLIEPGGQSGDGKTSAERLQDLGSLLCSILYTQGSTAPSGELQPIASRPAKLRTAASYRKLAALQEALTTTGSGRFEIVQDAFEQGLFEDLRMIDLTIRGLTDPYAEIATFIEEKVLPTLGTEVISLLAEQFDPNGGKLDARRLRVMVQTDRDRYEEVLFNAAQNGSDDVRETAIQLLSGMEQYEAHLIEWTKERKKQLREAAYQALSSITTDAAIQCLFAGLKGKDASTVAYAAASNESKVLKQMVIDELQERIAALPASELEEKKVQKEVEQITGWMIVVAHYENEQLQEIYKNVLREPMLVKRACFPIGYRAAEYLSRYGTAEVLDLLEKTAVSHDKFTVHALEAGLRLLSPAQFYDRFRTLTDQEGKLTRHKKYVNELLNFIKERVGKSGYEYIDAPWNGANEQETAYFLRGLDAAELSGTWDARWLDYAIAVDDLQLVSFLAVPGHDRAEAYLREKLHKSPELRSRYSEHLLLGLRRMQVEDLSELLMKVLEDERNKNYLYTVDGHIWELMLQLPASYRDRLEAVLPRFSYCKKQVEYLIATMETGGTN